MIDDVLKERQEGDKPRFFLHEELKAWLANNMNISVLTRGTGFKAVGSIAYIDQPAFNRYRETVTLTTGYEVSSMTTIDGTPIGYSSNTHIDLSPIINVIDVLTKRVHELETVRNPDMVQLIANQMVMQNEIVELKKQLDGKA